MAAQHSGWPSRLAGLLDNTLIRNLVKDPESDAKFPNDSARAVMSGHFVNVRPTPLPRPRLVHYSTDMLQRLGLSEEEAQTQEFARIFSADLDVLPGAQAWATPYALSIYGSEMYDNDPFNGHGYGDGRALSFGEFSHNGEHWELQWKGSGQTPFSRSGDGRAVLRSSVREFLVSEAMFRLGVPTTRAVSLVTSETLHIKRPWYKSEGPDFKNDPRWNALPQQLQRILMSQMRQPNVMQNHRTAITVRAAPSFLRVGQVECFYRRARDNKENGEEHLRLILEQVMRREYPEIASSDLPFPEKLLQVLREFSVKQAVLTTNWLRVGFAQGNYNSDNCLLSGRTMDYGPFGFMEIYDSQWAAWTGSGSHFAFRNQPQAGRMNLKSFAQALTPLLDDKQKQEAEAIVQNYTEDVLPTHLYQMQASKLGLESREQAMALFKDLEPLLEGVDYTILFRELCKLTKNHINENCDGVLVSLLEKAFYRQPDVDQWANWLRRYLDLINKQNLADADRQRQMRAVNPKYIPREWMLVEAYKLAEALDFSRVHQLLELFQNPYDEQPECEEQYYIKTPDQYQDKGGITFMT